MHISGSTSVYGIIGQPVEHSLSPLFQNYFLQSFDINGCYAPFPVVPQQLEVALQGLHAAGIQGLNVTIPHKTEVFRQVDSDAAAQRIGAVNTLKHQDHGWIGCNTDYIGIQMVLNQLQANPERALIFGAGGTTRAAIHALSAMGTQQLWLTNRTRSRAEALQVHIKTHYPNMQCTVLDWSQSALKQVLVDIPLAINCSSIGLHEDDRFPFQLSGDGVAMDVVYRPDGNTAFCRAAGTRLCCDGLPMLLAQGAASFQWWHEGMTIDYSQSLHWLQSQLGRKANSPAGATSLPFTRMSSDSHA